MCSFSNAIKIALVIAAKWGWSEAAVQRLAQDLWDYHLAKVVYTGGREDGQKWWQELPLSAEEHPIEAMALLIFAIVPHVAELERLFSNLVDQHSKKRNWLGLETLEFLRQLCGHYVNIILKQRVARGL